jgi:hypothetical protein
MLPLVVVSQLVPVRLPVSHKESNPVLVRMRGRQMLSLVIGPTRTLLGLCLFNP